MKKRLYIFDMDGTLLPHSTGLIELAKQLGTEETLHQLDQLFSEKKLSTTDFTYQVAELWGEINPQIGYQAFLAASKIADIKECLEHIKSEGSTSCLITMSQDVFALNFKDYGFDYIYSTSYPPNTKGTLSILTPEDKPKITKALCNKLGLLFEDSVALGDSLSDEPLFAELTETVAVNASMALQNISKYHYNGNSILEAYKLLD